MRFQLICFDLDGTLVDSQADIRAALIIALAAVPPGDELLDARALGSAGLGLPLEDFFALARPEMHRHDDRTLYRRFVDAYRSHYHAHLLDSTKAFPGVVETLERLRPLRERGLRTTVATTKRTDTARRVVRELGLETYFDAVHGTDGIPHKPAPDLLYLCARSVDRSTSTGLMVGDTERDLLAGKAAGMRTCGVKWGVQGEAGLSPHRPDHLIDHFTELLEIVGAD